MIEFGSVCPRRITVLCGDTYRRAMSLLFLVKTPLLNRRRMRTLLREMDVIRSVARYLRDEKRYDVEAVESVYERGPDIIARSPKLKHELAIEAKGQTSSKSDSNRFGKEFNKNQKEDHLGRALVKALQFVSKGKITGIALPSDETDVALVNSIKPALERLGVVVFLVRMDKTVEIGVGKLP